MDKLLFLQKEMAGLKLGITIPQIKSKIRTLSNQISKERQKIVSSKRSGASASGVYRPTLWCYNDLEFLFNLNDRRQGSSNINFANNNTAETVEEADTVEEAIEAEEIQISKKQKSRCNVEDFNNTAQKSLQMWVKIIEKKPPARDKGADFCRFFVPRISGIEIRRYIRRFKSRHNENSMGG